MAHPFSIRRRPRPRPVGKPVYCRPWLEPLERRTAPATLQGTVWADRNGSGVRTPDDPGLAGVTVYLDNNADLHLDPGDPATVTGPDGQYTFTGLPSNQSYRVAVAPTDTLVQTSPPAVSANLFQAEIPSSPGMITFQVPGSADQSQPALSPFDLPTAPAGVNPPGFALSPLIGNFQRPIVGPWLTNFSSNNGTVQVDTLLSPVIDLTATTGPLVLEFNSSLLPSEGTTAAMGVLVNGIETQLATSADWAMIPANADGSRSIFVDLSAFAGQQVQLFFQYTSAVGSQPGVSNSFSGSSTPGVEWTINDVTVRPAPWQRVAVENEEIVTGADFGCQLLADLSAGPVKVDQTFVAWDGSITVHYSLQNQGRADAGPFDLELQIGAAGSGANDQVLARIPVAGLAAGASLSGTDVVDLPGQSGAPATYYPGEAASISLVVDPDGAVSDGDRSNNITPPEEQASLTVLPVVAAVEGDSTPANAGRAALPFVFSGSLDSADRQDFVEFPAPEDGRLTAELHPDVDAGGNLAVDLYGSEEQLLMTSDDSGSENLRASIDLHVKAGSYYLAVRPAAGPGASTTGAYRLAVLFTAAEDPGEPQPASYTTSVVVADVNGDGRPDLITTSSTRPGGEVWVLLGNGDGSFRQGVNLNTRGPYPVSVVAADVTGDGKEDLIVIPHDPYHSPSVFLNNGDGTFQSPIPVDAPPGAVIAAADLNGDGKADLIFTDYSTDQVSVLLGNGDGTFQDASQFPTGIGPTRVIAADLAGDGKLDLITTNEGSDDLSILRGNGDGAFQPPIEVPLGMAAASVQVANVNGDGNPDLIAANGSGEIVVLLSNGDGTFRPQPPFHVDPGLVVAADVNRDGKADLLIADPSTPSISVLLGNGDGSFQPARHVFVGAAPDDLAAVDLNADGDLDLVTINAGQPPDPNDNTLSVFLGNGDGSFQQAQQQNLTGKQPGVAVAADLNGDGHADLVIPNEQSLDVSVLLGNGDGSFQQSTVPVGGAPVAAAVADLNGDGRPDLITIDDPTANSSFVGVSILSGNGDGTFQPPRLIPFGGDLTSLAAADLTGDGRLDLIVSDSINNVVWVLPGNGDGSFQEPRPFEVGSGPVSVAVADLNGDGRPDVITANAGSGDLSVLPGNGDGTFQPERRLAVGIDPSSVQTADLNGDGVLDLIVGGYNLIGYVSVLAGNGDGTFQPPRVVGQLGAAAIVADVDGDGRPDIISTVTIYGGGSTTVDVLLNNGDGSFTSKPFNCSVYFQSVTAVDLNGDGLIDLVAVDPINQTVSVFLGEGNGTFQPASLANTVSARQTPHVGDFNGDGIPDTVVLDDGGQILYRQGLPGGQTLFEAPVIVNPGRQARDVVPFQTADGLALAAADETGGVSLYLDGPTGWVRYGGFATGLDPTRIAAADLTGDGLDDLVTANSLSDSVTVAFQQPGGGFGTLLTLPVGAAPADVTFLDGPDGPDVVVADRSSGDVTVLYNDPDHTFSRTARYKAGAGLSYLEDVNGVGQVNSPDEPVSVVTGDFTGDGRPAVLVVDQGTHALQVLPGDPGGGFANPDPTLRTSTSQGLFVNDLPGQAVAADFNDDGVLDVAVLMQDRDEVWVYKGTGDGRFVLEFWAPAGNSPTGLTAADINSDGRMDLLVGNSFGDVLILLGNGDGTFRPFVRSDPRTPFVVADLNGDGGSDVVLADPANDLASVQVRDPGTNAFTLGDFQRDSSNGLIDPGAVAVADLNGDGLLDLIFANTGGNDVLIFPGQAGGSFAEQPLAFFAGDSPVAVTVAHLNDNSGDYPDLIVANEGSNDVSILLNNSGGDGGDGVINNQDLFRLGPRLETGGLGPNAVTVRDVNGDGVPDLLVTNGQSGTLTTIPGIGSNGVSTGFFNDTARTVQTISSNPIVQTQIIDANLGYALTQQGDLIRFDPTSGDSLIAFASSAGRQIEAFQVVSAPDAELLFTADADGSVSVLDGKDFGFSPLLSQASGLENPSALEVIERGGGLFDVYLTQAAETRPVVLTIGLRAELEQVDGKGGQPFALVAVLLTETGPDRPGQDAATLGETAEVFNALVAGRTETLDAGPTSVVKGMVIPPGETLLATVEGGGEEQATREEASADVEVHDESEPRPRATLQQFILGVEGVLQRLERPDEETPNVEQPPPEQPRMDEQFLGLEGVADKGSGPRLVEAKDLALADWQRFRALRQDEVADAFAWWHPQNPPSESWRDRQDEELRLIAIFSGFAMLRGDGKRRPEAQFNVGYSAAGRNLSPCR